MNAVIATRPGLVAVGRWNRRLDDDLDYHAAVWTSDDGVTWSQVPYDEAVFGGAGAR